MLGAQLVVRALARRGVTTVFSLSGNQIMPIYDACIDAHIRIVHVRHEAAAVFMADAWAQVTGEIGVALLTAGPGVSNGIAPLFSALQAESPVLLLSGDSSLAEDGLGAFQELDQAAMTAPLTKFSKRVMSVEALATDVDHAIDVALSPRCGPVHLALPFDLLTRDSGLSQLPVRLPQPAAAAVAKADVATFAHALKQAQRPLVLLGPSGARGASRVRWQAQALALQVPVVAMESPRGLRDPSLGALAEAMAQADLIVLAGKALDFTLGFGRPATLGSAPVVVIEPDAEKLARARRLLGERLVLGCAQAPEDLLAAVQAHLGASPAEASRQAWCDTVATALARRAPALAAPAPGQLAPDALCAAVQRFIAEVPEPILVVDGGEFGQWAQSVCQAPVRLINGMSGAIGGGICYAIAAKIARPQSTVVLLMGDGTAGFHLPEFDTAVRECAGIVAVIGNDHRWNAEHVIQLRTYGAERLIGCSLSPSAQYHAVVQSLGGQGAHVDSLPALHAALQAALPAVAAGQPVCINVEIEGTPAPVVSASSTAGAAGAAAH